VLDLLDNPERRIGFGKTSSQLGKRYMVYAESVIPPNPRPPLRNNEAYAGLGYAFYLGNAERTDKALLTSTLDLPLDGTRATATVPYGDTALLLVVTDEDQLGGPLLAALPWLIAAAGLVVTIAAVILTERLQRRRDHAETLVAALADIAGENARLYAEQRTVAQRLQQSLLPKALPAVPGVELAARYEPGVDALDIGGDWYDVMQLADDRLLFVVGDVSGRGLDAATLMASLRYATRAYAAQGDDPAAIATKLGKLIDVARDGHFATMLCGVIDVARREVTLVNAGHPDPLIVEAGRARFAGVPLGAPVGVGGGPAYRAARVAVPVGADLLAFTDGLYERRDEPVDVSLERLRGVAAGRHESLDALLGKVLDDLAPRRGADDTALLGVRWES
jgi:serine phosphatase RsbU (regulator of sigma subunit)